MKFKLLGPLEVEAEGETIIINPPRQRIVLSMLLLNANRVVSTHRLIEAMWDGNPPKTAKSQVHIAVSTLRQRLSTWSDRLIATQPPGYLISVPAESVDLLQFEALVSAAKAAVQEQRPTMAVDYFRQSLKLWRGGAVAGVEGDVIQHAATWLKERWLMVQQECLELELQLGHHRNIISELTALTSRFPLNEAFRSMLMLALYRAGRQAEALDVFQHGRRVLIEEIGLEPSRELQELEEFILIQDARLNVHLHDDPAGAAIGRAFSSGATTIG